VGSFVLSGQERVKTQSCDQNPYISKVSLFAVFVGEEVDVTENTFCRFNNSCGLSYAPHIWSVDRRFRRLDRKTRQQLEQRAQSFVEAYRKRRDFKDCFQAFFARDAVERMKLARFFKSMDMDPALIQNATTDELAHAYVAPL
jgi:hypothetical protein